MSTEQSLVEPLKASIAIVRERDDLRVKNAELSRLFNEQTNRALLALSNFVSVLKLADELCDAVDRAAEDIGGSRLVKDILAELGPAVDAAKVTMTVESAPATDPRFAWLIEKSDRGWPLWRSLTSFKPEAGWTNNATEALQFSRKQDAEAFIESDAGDGEIYEAKPVEHGFHGLQQRPQA